MPGTRSLPRSSRWNWRNNLPRHWWIWVIVGALVGVLGWVGVRGLMAKAELEAAQTLISQLKTQALDLDAEGAQATLDEVSAHTDAAVSLTNDPVWRGFGLIPLVGTNFTVVRELAVVAQDVVRDVASPLVEVLATIDPASLAPKDGAIDLAPFEDAVPAIQEANAGAQAAVSAVAAISADGALGPVVGARDKVAGLLDEVAPLLESANSILPLLAPALGSEGPRTYVVMFQNNAEARSLGGTALSFALIRMDGGRINLEMTVPAGFANFPHYDASIIPVPDGVDDLFPGSTFGKFIANATVRPSFASAAEITQENWIRTFGYPVDGVVSIDPVALGYVLRATDPIALSTGDSLTSQNLVKFLLNDIYQRFNTGDALEDNRLQDVVYAEAVGATFSALTSGSLDPVALFGALHQGFVERRVLLWSTHEEESVQISAGELGGALPVSDAQTDRVGVYFQDYVGSKMNFYLNQSVRLAQGECRADGRQSYRVTIDLANEIQPEMVPGLSPSILGAYKNEGLEPGVQRMLLLLYAPPGSQFVGASLNGVAVTLQALHDTDYPVGEVAITLPPGTSGQVTFDLVSAEVGTKTLAAQVTPLVKPTLVTNEPLDCATVPAS